MRTKKKEVTSRRKGNVFQKADMFSLKRTGPLYGPNTRTDNLPGQGLKVSSTMARFKLKKIHTQEPLEDRSGQEVAIGDQWALFDRQDKRLINVVGDFPEEFKQTKYSSVQIQRSLKYLKPQSTGLSAFS
jgi:hypothetical protein